MLFFSELAKQNVAICCSLLTGMGLEFQLFTTDTRLSRVKGKTKARWMAWRSDGSQKCTSPIYPFLFFFFFLFLSFSFFRSFPFLYLFFVLLLLLLKFSPAFLHAILSLFFTSLCCLFVCFWFVCLFAFCSIMFMIPGVVTFQLSTTGQQSMVTLVKP